jgi:hypothetical protein
MGGIRTESGNRGVLEKIKNSRKRSITEKVKKDTKTSPGAADLTELEQIAVGVQKDVFKKMENQLAQYKEINPKKQKKINNSLILENIKNIEEIHPKKQKNTEINPKKHKKTPENPEDQLAQCTYVSPVQIIQPKNLLSMVLCEDCAKSSNSEFVVLKSDGTMIYNIYQCIQCQTKNVNIYNITQ